MRIQIIGLSLLASSFGAVVADAPDLTPKLFAPGVISGPANDWTPTFSPDGKRIEFTRSGLSWGFILESELKGGKWAEPVIAPYSGEWPDSSPTEAWDGSYVVFESQRPATAALAAEVRAKHLPIKASALWKVARQGQGWGEPVRLPGTVNITDEVWKPSVDAAGDVYFTSKDEAEKNLHLYRSVFKDGSYLKAEKLPFSDGSTLDVDPAVAPDESFLVFSSLGHAPFTADNREHLFIVFRTGGVWGPVQPLCFDGVSAAGFTLDDDAVLGPDGQTLYFGSDRTEALHLPKSRGEAEQDVQDMQGWNNGNANVWSLSLKPWLEAARQGKPLPACPDSR